MLQLNERDLIKLDKLVNYTVYSNYKVNYLPLWKC